MEIQGNQLRELHQALLSAFPARRALEMMLAFELNWNLDDIAAQGTMPEAVFDLIKWARARGELKQLIQAALRTTPNSPDLQAFANHIAMPATTPLPLAVSTRREELVDLIVQLPVAASFIGRSTLLDGIPATAFNRSDSNQLLDVALIVGQLSDLQPMSTGVRPLQVLIDNALTYAVPGTAAAQQLQAMKREVAQSQ
jgi:hypothetical protein